MTRFVYVLPAGRFRWEVRYPDDDPTYPLRERSLFYRLKRDALIAARAIAIVVGGEVQPHDRRGRIQDPDSYGGDSPRRRG